MSQSATRQRLVVEDIGNVAVVNFVDKKLLDEQNITEIGRQLFRAVDAGRRRQVLLNMGNVEFLSSAALGKFITLMRKLQTAGGRLAICGADPQIYEVFSITKLNQFFSFFNSEQEALQGFPGDLGAYDVVRCPLADCPGAVMAHVGLVGTAVSLLCGECSGFYSVLLPDLAGAAGGAAVVASMTTPTYQNESVGLKGPAPFVLTLSGRLDLFASEILERVWRSAPEPRRLVVDLRAMERSTPPGVEVLVRLLRDEAGDDRAVVLVGDKQAPLFEGVTPGFPLARHPEEARPVLGELTESDRPLWQVTVRPGQ